MQNSNSIFLTTMFPGNINVSCQLGKFKIASMAVMALCRSLNVNLSLCERNCLCRIDKKSATMMGIKRSDKWLRNTKSELKCGNLRCLVKNAMQQQLWPYWKTKLLAVPPTWPALQCHRGMHVGGVKCCVPIDKDGNVVMNSGSVELKEEQAAPPAVEQLEIDEYTDFELGPPLRRNFEVLYEAEDDEIVSPTFIDSCQPVVNNQQITLNEIDALQMDIAEDEITVLDELPGEYGSAEHSIVEPLLDDIKVADHAILEPIAESTLQTDQNMLLPQDMLESNPKAAQYDTFNTIDEMVPNVLPITASTSGQTSKYPKPTDKPKTPNPDTELSDSYWGMSYTGDENEDEEVGDIDDNDTITWKWK